jgi:TolB protein
MEGKFMRKFGLILFLCLVLSLLAGCSPGETERLVPNTDTPQIPTPTSVPQSMTPIPPPTSTPVPVTETPSSTDKPEPTITPTPEPSAEPIELIENIAYVPDGDPAQVLSIYLPPEEIRKSFTLLIQGGEYMPDLVDYFTSRGYPVISYTGRDDSYQNEIQDSFCALAWVHANASEHGLSAENVIPLGGSMWGGNAAILGLVDDPTPFLEDCPHGLPETGRVQAVIALAGVFDYSEEGDFFYGFIGSISDFMGGTPDESPESWAEASAITWVNGDEPHFLLIHGTGDTNVFPHQSEKFAVVLEEAGVDVELVLVPNVNHRGIVRNTQAFEAVESYLENLPPKVEGLGDIAYCFQPMTGNSLHQIYTINLDGSENRQLIQVGIGLNHHDWSPDGSKMAAVGYFSSSTWSIYAFDIDGTNLTRLTDLSGVWDSEPAWSPDSNRIAFTRVYPRENDREELWLMDADGGDQHWIGLEGFAAKWSPDGTRFIFTSNLSGNYEIYTSNIDGTDVRQMTYTEADESFPIWSPDGDQIAFSASTGQWNTFENMDTYEVYIMNADGTGVYKLTANDVFDIYPRWSPDGSSILFVSARAGSDHWEVFVMDLDGSSVRRVTRTPGEATAIGPVWNPDY